MRLLSSWTQRYLNSSISSTSSPMMEILFDLFLVLLKSTIMCHCIAQWLKQAAHVRRLHSSCSGLWPFAACLPHSLCPAFLSVFTRPLVPSKIRLEKKKIHSHILSLVPIHATKRSSSSIYCLLPITDTPHTCREIEEHFQKGFFKKKKKMFFNLHQETLVEMIFSVLANFMYSDNANKSRIWWRNNFFKSSEKVWEKFI